MEGWNWEGERRVGGWKEEEEEEEEEEEDGRMKMEGVGETEGE